MTSKSAEQPKGAFNFSVMETLPAEPTEKEWYEMRKKRRDVLVEKVEEGLLRPEEAEQEALRQGIDPLVSTLEDLSALTSEMIFWTLEMVAVWVGTLDGDAARIRAVHRHYRPSYIGKRVWRKTNKYYSATTGLTYWSWQNNIPEDGRQCFRTHELEDTHFGIGYIDFDGEIRHFPPLHSFFPQLRTHLLRGEVIATGEVATSPSFRRHDIKADVWDRATFDVGDDGPCLCINDWTVYRKILFRAPELLKLYPNSLISRPYPYKVYPWKAAHKIEGVFQEQYKMLIVDRLRELFPPGIPDWRPKKILYLELMDALGENLAARWWATPNPEETEKRQEAFRIAMNRILKTTTEKKLIEVDDFSYAPVAPIQDL